MSVNVLDLLPEGHRKAVATPRGTAIPLKCCMCNADYVMKRRDAGRPFFTCGANCRQRKKGFMARGEAIPFPENDDWPAGMEIPDSISKKPLAEPSTRYQDKVADLRRSIQEDHSDIYPMVKAQLDMVELFAVDADSTGVASPSQQGQIRMTINKINDLVVEIESLRLQQTSQSLNDKIEASRGEYTLPPWVDAYRQAKR